MIAFSASVPVLSAGIAILFAICMLGLLFWVWKAFFKLIFKRLSDFFSTRDHSKKGK